MRWRLSLKMVFEAWTQGFEDFAAMAPGGAVERLPSAP